MEWQPIETAPKDGTWVILEGEFSGGDIYSVRVGRWKPIVDEHGVYEWEVIDAPAYGFIDEDFEFPSKKTIMDDLFLHYPDGRVCSWATIAEDQP